MTNKIQIKNSIRLTVVLHLFWVLPFSCIAEIKDTIIIHCKDLNQNNLKSTNSTYLVYGKMAGSNMNINNTIVKIKVAKDEAKNEINIDQIWETDTVVHKASTVMDTKLSTKSHSSWWKKKGYTENYNFEKHTLTFEGTVSDKVKLTTTQSFESLTDNTFVNWHSDLVLFPLLPFAENKIFKIYFYEPGYDKPRYEIYEVLKSELIELGQQKIDCWVLIYKIKQPAGYQKFYIDKQSHQLLKEEDSFGNFMRYKLKVFLGD